MKLERRRTVSFGPGVRKGQRSICDAVPEPKFKFGVIYLFTQLCYRSSLSP